MPTPGTTFGRFTLAHVLGHGGAGVVWRAIEAGTGRAVAVKLLPLDTGGAEHAAREAEVMARVRHPGVVRVHATLQDHGHAAIVMDLARGSLATLVHRAGPLPPTAALEAAVLAAEALAASHAVGVVHRDIKPHNLLWFDDAPHVRLADFGIAQAPAHARTRTGALLGSVPFMAPEQRRDARAVQPATDVYALAVTLAWLILGEAPDDLFAPDAEARLRASGIPAPLASLLASVGAWLPTDRPPHAGALLERLREVRLDPGPSLVDWIAGQGEGSDSWGGGAEPPRNAPPAHAPGPTGAPVTPRTRLEGWTPALLGVLLGGALVAWGAWVSRRAADATYPSVPVRIEGAGATGAPPCSDAIRTWVDDLRMGPRESIEALIEDLDRDGHPDVLVNNNHSGSVSVWWGRTGGMPLDALEIPTGRTDSRPAVADLDGDGTLDLVVGNNDDSRLGVVRGIGERRFAPVTAVFQSPGPRRPLVVDTDGDTHPDLLFALGNETASLALRAGSRPLEWAPQQLIAPERIPWARVRQAGLAPWVLLRDTRVGGWWRLDPGAHPLTLVPLTLPADAMDVLVARPPGSESDALHVVHDGHIERIADDGSRCVLADTLPNSAPVALGDLDGDGTLDAVRLDTCARCESNHVFVRGLR